MAVGNRGLNGFAPPLRANGLDIAPGRRIASTGALTLAGRSGSVVVNSDGSMTLTPASGKTIDLTSLNVPLALGADGSNVVGLTMVPASYWAPEGLPYGTTWTPAVRVGGYMVKAGSGAAGSADEATVAITSRVYQATNSLVGYEKMALFVIAETADPSTALLQRGAVGADIRGYITPGNTAGQVWGAFAEARTGDATADGYMVCLETQSTNHGSAQPAFGTLTTKIGVHVVAYGTVNSTAAVAINAMPGVGWYKGLYAASGSIVSTGNFIEYYGSDELTNLFVVSRGGSLSCLGAGPHTLAPAAFAGAYQSDQLAWNLALVRMGRTMSAAGGAGAGSGDELILTVQADVPTPTGSQVGYEKVGLVSYGTTTDPSYNAVMYLTVTVPGSGYTSPPALAIAAPLGTSTLAAGAVTATADAYLGINTATPSAGGTGYAVGNVLTLTGGTKRITAQVTVSTVSGGVVTAVTPLTAGWYSAVPGNPVATTGGGGSGCTLTINWKVTAAQVTRNGYGYTVTNPAVTPSGGGGTGATFTATATTYDVSRGVVGLDGRGYISPYCTNGQAWAIYGIASVGATSDGFVACCELECRNGASDQPLLDRATSKVGLHVVALGGAWGTGAGTAAIYINAGGGSTWHKGLYADPADLGTAGPDAFAELSGRYAVRPQGWVHSTGWVCSRRQWGYNFNNLGSTTSPSTTAFTVWGSAATATTTAATITLAHGATTAYSTGGYANLATSTTSGNQAKVEHTAFTQTQRQFNPIVTYRIRTGAAADIQNARIVAGLFAASPTADTIASNFAGFRYSTAVDGTTFWRVFSNDGGTAGSTLATTTTAAIAADTDYDLTVDASDGTTVKFFINRAWVATHTTKLPTSTTDLGHHVSITTLTTAIKNLKVSAFVMATN